MAGIRQWWSRLRGGAPAAPPGRMPFRRVETSGQDALAAWERLKAEGEGWPVAAAAGLAFPAALLAHLAAEQLPAYAQELMTQTRWHFWWD